MPLLQNQPFMIKILLCDDHPIVTSGLQGLFSENPDFQIIGVVNTVREIAAAIHHFCPEIVFLDINMDGENMVDRISAFKEIRQTLSIVVFSSYNLPSLVSRAFAEGADAYLLKSSTRNEILSACAAVGQQQKFIGTDVNIRNSDRLRIIDATHTPMDKFEVLQQLTAKETSIFHLVAAGKTEAEIAQQLSISKHTVHTHRKNLMAKLKLHSSADFVRFSIEINS